MSGRACLECGAQVSAAAGFYELIRQPGGAAAGQFYTLCSDPCLVAFLRGGEPAEPEARHQAPDPAWAGYRAAEAELASWFGVAIRPEPEAAPAGCRNCRDMRRLAIPGRCPICGGLPHEQVPT